MTRVAAYCRVSTDKEDQANSFEAQQRFFREWIEGEPEWTLWEIYADEGLSGTSTRRRASFNRMIQDAREGKFDLIVTKEVSRFARNTVDTLEYTRELRKRGVGVLFLNDNINTLDGDGELRLTIMASMAQEESRKTSDRVKWGQRRQMEQGVVFGGPLLGYRVEKGQMTVDPAGAEVVRSIFHKYLEERKGSSVIARELQEEGMLSSRGNVKWSAATVLKILKNEKYCGDLVQRKTYTPDHLTHEKKYNRGQEPMVVLRDHHEPIIHRETWNAVQTELARRSGNRRGEGHGNRYPLSGKLKCGRCGSSFVARTKKRGSGAVFRTWRCGKAAAEGSTRLDKEGAILGCDIGRQLREEMAMDILKQTLQDVEMDREEVIQSLVQLIETVLKNERNSGEARLHRLERELEEKRVKKERLLELLLCGTISDEDYRLMNERFNARIGHLQKELDGLKMREQETGAAEEKTEVVRAVIRDIVTGERADGDFYGRLLRQMTIFGDGRVEVSLAGLPARWLFTLEEGKLGGGGRVQTDSSVPISVNTALSSG